MNKVCLAAESTMTHLAHKIRLDPTAAQEAYFRRACGTARFAWNWGLAKWGKEYEAGNKPSGFSLRKEFNLLKKTEFNWAYEVCKDAGTSPFAIFKLPSATSFVV